MRGWVFLAFIALATTNPIQSRAAGEHTGLTACNKTGVQVRIALAADCNYSISGCRAWSQGWWTIDPDACKTLPDVYLSGMGDAKYYYLAIGPRLRGWSGTTPFCVDLRNRFEYREGAASGRCNTTGSAHRSKRLFRAIQVPETDIPQLPGFTFDITVSSGERFRASWLAG